MLPQDNLDDMPWYCIGAASLLICMLWLVGEMNDDAMELCLKNHSQNYCENTLGKD